MKLRLWMIFCLAFFFAFSAGPALAQGNGHGHDKDKHGDEGDRDEHFYRDHDRESAHAWYNDHRDHLPPGLAKKDRLPPGLERQLVVRGTLPPGLQKHIQPCPEELERRLPPPPPDCAHVLIGGHLVLLNRRTYMVVDVFHFEL